MLLRGLFFINMLQLSKFLTQNTVWHRVFLAYLPLFYQFLPFYRTLAVFFQDFLSYYTAMSFFMTK